jgi:hypothetical protein
MSSALPELRVAAQDYDAGFFGYMESNGYPADTDELQDDLREVAAAVSPRPFATYSISAPQNRRPLGTGPVSVRESHTY